MNKNVISSPAASEVIGPEMMPASVSQGVEQSTPEQFKNEVNIFTSRVDNLVSDFEKYKDEFPKKLDEQKKNVQTAEDNNFSEDEKNKLRLEIFKNYNNKISEFEKKIKEFLNVEDQLSAAVNTVGVDNKKRTEIITLL
ncbi:MAG: hypothetical protein WCK11_05965, partial [Candidatus Falkowbacteria bacterium]